MGGGENHWKHFSHNFRTDPFYSQNFPSIKYLENQNWLKLPEITTKMKKIFTQLNKKINMF